MKVFAISDLHLSSAVEGKSMDRFGEEWRDHGKTIRERWERSVGPDDLVLVPGDISWASRIEQAMPDLEYLASLPGRKVIIKGNHEHWWSSIGKVRAALPESVVALHADAVAIGRVHVCGTRLWLVPGIDVGPFAVDEEPSTLGEIDVEQNVKIYRRELGRLDSALKVLRALPTEGVEPIRIVMTHFPPCGVDLAENEFTRMFADAGIDHVVFGHMHGLKEDATSPLYGERDGVRYHLVSCDYTGFAPKLVAS